MLLFISQVMQQPIVNTKPASVAPTCNATGAWAMDEGSGTTLHDSISGNTAGIIGTGVAWTANVIKSGATSPVWNSSTAAPATSTTLTNFNGSVPFSVGEWVVNSVAGPLIDASNVPGGTDQGWSLQLQGGTGFIHFYVTNTVSTNSVEVLGNITASTSSLAYVVATYDGSKTAAGVNLYVNGARNTNTVLHDNLTGSTAFASPVVFNGVTGFSSVGAGPQGYAEIYPCVLSGAKIASNFAAGPGIY